MKLDKRKNKSNKKDKRFYYKNNMVTALRTQCFFVHRYMDRRCIIMTFGSKKKLNNVTIIIIKYIRLNKDAAQGNRPSNPSPFIYVTDIIIRVPR